MIVHKIKNKLPQNTLLYRCARSIYLNVFLKIYRQFLYLLPRATAHRIIYSDVFGKELDLSSPRDINQKIHWLIVYKFGEKEAELYDKFRVKQYIKNLGIPDIHVAELYATYSKASEIDLTSLPDKFVLKTAHGCDNSYICVDKSIFDLATVKKKLKAALNSQPEKMHCEYFSVKTTKIIMCEEYINDRLDMYPLSYNFHCINGKAVIISIIRKYANAAIRYDSVDRDWESLDCCLVEPVGKGTTQKPLNFDRMLEIAEELAKPFPWVRVDLYNCGGKIYFGEFTFTGANGNLTCFTQETLDRLGDMLDLSAYDQK